MSDPIETAILNKIAALEPGKSIEPAEVAKELQPEQWQRMLPKVRATALGLMRQGKLTITKKGKAVDPDNFRGVTRLRHNILCCQLTQKRCAQATGLGAGVRGELQSAVQQLVAFGGVEQELVG